jgi:hypothetical protein
MSFGYAASSCLVDLSGLTSMRTRSVPQHRVHDDREAASQSNPPCASLNRLAISRFVGDENQA